MVSVYLPASEESTSLSETGCDQSHTAKSTDTQQRSSSVEWLMDLYQQLQSGPMSEHLAQEFCQASTSFTEDSHARTLAAQELEKAWTESEPAYSVKQYDLFENVSLSSYSSKMCQESENMCLPSGKSLRRLATIVGTASLVPQKLGLPMPVIDGGYLPTLTANEGGRNRSGSKGARIRPSLGMMARKNQWPTLLSSEWKVSGSQQAHKRQMKKRNSPSLGRIFGSATEGGGALNPEWAEWLMGYPIGWTELSAWVMQSYLCRRKQHLKYLRESNDGTLPTNKKKRQKVQAPSMDNGAASKKTTTSDGVSPSQKRRQKRQSDRKSGNNNLKGPRRSSQPETSDYEDLRDLRSDIHTTPNETEN